MPEAAYPQAEPALSLTRIGNRIYFQRSPHIGRRKNSPNDRFACCRRCELCELEVGGLLRAVRVAQREQHSTLSGLWERRGPEPFTCSGPIAAWPADSSPDCRRR